jgi:predicted transcriptional regulator
MKAVAAIRIGVNVSLFSRSSRPSTTRFCHFCRLFFGIITTDGVIRRIDPKNDCNATLLRVFFIASLSQFLITWPARLGVETLPKTQPGSLERSKRMATVRDLLAKKGNHVWSIEGGISVEQAALYMTQHKIGAVLVLHGEQIAGMFSERDLLQRVVAEGRDPASTTVGEVMTTEVACCTVDTSLEEARVAMKNRRIRHLPVVNEDQRLLGVISIGDLNAYQVANQEQTIFLLNEYLYGRV